MIATVVLVPVVESSLTVMTYNVRYSTAKDGENSWSHRKAALLERIRANDPDILGVQEALVDQVKTLELALPGHRRIGVGRDDGADAGEFSAIFVRKGFPIAGEGTRWISDAPTLPGSKGPGASLPRIYSWALVKVGAKSRVLVVNTHFDHESSAARVLGARQIAEFVTTYKGSDHTIVMGDFNCTPKDVPPTYLMVAADLSPMLLEGNQSATFNAFRQGQFQDPIDLIFVSSKVGRRSVVIDRTSYHADGVDRYPSDHFPVVARITLP